MVCFVLLAFLICTFNKGVLEQSKGETHDNEDSIAGIHANVDLLQEIDSLQRTLEATRKESSRKDRVIDHLEEQLTQFQEVQNHTPASKEIRKLVDKLHREVDRRAATIAMVRCLALWRPSMVMIFVSSLGGLYVQLVSNDIILGCT